MPEGWQRFLVFIQTFMLKFIPLIAAAGLGSRSGLDYPKALFEINGIPILVQILEKFKTISAKSIIVINQNYQDQFSEALLRFNYHYPRDFEFVYQNEPKGMGDAVLQVSQCSDALNAENLLLQWGDIPFIRITTIKKMLEHHFLSKSEFTLVTADSDLCYTKVIRNKLSQQVLSVEETRETGSSPSSGERDIGLFIFNRKIVLDLLSQDLENKFGLKTGEHSFLYVIKHLASLGHKTVAINIANEKEVISLNSLEDINTIRNLAKDHTL